MMMRDKESGMVFQGETEAVAFFCRGRRCETCDMAAVSPQHLCRMDALRRPFDAARAMGMEVVRYRLTEDERRRMQDFGAEWVTRNHVIELMPWHVPSVELWAAEPRLISGGHFSKRCYGSGTAEDVFDARVATCKSGFFPSVSPGERIGVDDVVVVFEDHKEAGK